MSTELQVVEKTADTTIATASESRIKSSDMPVLRRTPAELAQEQQACELIVKEVLGAGSLLVPEDLRKDPKSLLMLVAYARDMGFSHWEVLQNAFCIKGKIAFNTKFLISVLKNRFHMEPRYQFEGDGEATAVTVTFVDTTRVDENGDYLGVKGIAFRLTMKEGLASAQQGSQVWKSQPRKMLAYRACKMAVDIHFPGIMSGAEWGEREEYIEFANAGSYVPRDATARQVKIIRGNQNPELVGKLFPASRENGVYAKTKTEPVPETAGNDDGYSAPINMPVISEFMELKNLIASAPDVQYLQNIAEQIKVFEGTGELIESEITELRGLWKERKKELEGK